MLHTITKHIFSASEAVGYLRKRLKGHSSPKKVDTGSEGRVTQTLRTFSACSSFVDVGRCLLRVSADGSFREFIFSAFLNFFGRLRLTKL